MKGSPGAVTVHLGLENIHPRLLEQDDEEASEYLQEKKGGGGRLSSDYVFDHENYREYEM